MILETIEFFGLTRLAKKHLDNPVNWVAFIRRYNLSKEQQMHWRDRLCLEHHFDGELNA
ncbi:hypothetical protein [Vibrio sp. RE88]|uniref:hypothetical protein n=1 Tax=Vibrio sp. RE88 TaxID=2607610 RepID=UPI00149380A8|nr:hypothetical protein [Vibrio sp. RE88]